MILKKHDIMVPRIKKIHYARNPNKAFKDRRKEDGEEAPKIYLLCFFGTITNFLRGGQEHALGSTSFSVRICINFGHYLAISVRWFMYHSDFKSTMMYVTFALVRTVSVVS